MRNIAVTTTMVVHFTRCIFWQMKTGQDRHFAFGLEVLQKLRAHLHGDSDVGAASTKWKAIDKLVPVMLCHVCRGADADVR